MTVSRPLALCLEQEGRRDTYGWGLGAGAGDLLNRGRASFLGVELALVLEDQGRGVGREAVEVLAGAEAEVDKGLGVGVGALLAGGQSADSQHDACWNC